MKKLILFIMFIIFWHGAPLAYGDEEAQKKPSSATVEFCKQGKAEIDQEILELVQRHAEEKERVTRLLKSSIVEHSRALERLVAMFKALLTPEDMALIQEYTLIYNELVRESADLRLDSAAASQILDKLAEKYRRLLEPVFEDVIENKLFTDSMLRRYQNGPGKAERELIFYTFFWGNTHYASPVKLDGVSYPAISALSIDVKNGMVPLRLRIVEDDGVIFYLNYDFSTDLYPDYPEGLIAHDISKITDEFILKKVNVSYTYLLDISQDRNYQRLMEESRFYQTIIDKLQPLEDE